MLYFDSDYMRGGCPEVMEALVKTNLEQTRGYGNDPYTEEAKRLILESCGLTEGKVWLLVGGTQTNSTVIDGLLSRHQGVIAADTAHINVHEAGAIESCGHKVLTIPNKEGKLRASDVKNYLTDFYSDDTWEHMVSPGMVYISFPTELGTLYTLEELEALGNVCREADIPLYIDGARLGYGIAAPASDVTLKDIARIADIFYIGGTKTGAMFGEAVVSRRPELLPGFFSLIKQHGALLAKGRLLGIQFRTLFTDGLYERICGHAVDMALRLKEVMLQSGARLYMDSPTNQQFFVLPNKWIEALRQNVSFELWGVPGEKETPVRFVTDWETSESDIVALKSELDKVISN